MRSWHAISAWFRSSAGPIKTKKQKKQQKETRQFKHQVRDVLAELEEEQALYTEEEEELDVEK